MPLILHTSDWHLGASSFLTDSLQRQSNMIDEIFNIANKYKIDYLLMSGDVFHSYKIEEEVRTLFLKKLIEGNDYNFTSIYISGNHDVYKSSKSIVNLFDNI